MPSRPLKIALVHEWFTCYYGSEKVVEQILEIFPEADLFSLVDTLPAQERGFLKNKPVQTSFIQRLPWGTTKHRHYLPLFPLAIEQFDLSDYDLVITSSHAVAKGVLTHPDQLHVSYIHSPIRYAWDLQHQYLAEANLTRGLKSWLARLILHYLRLWDVRTTNGVDHYLANSRFVGRRIEKIYGRTAQVIAPPVDIEFFQLNEIKEDFYLTIGRIVPYKKMNLIVEAFAHLPQSRLIVIGEGPDLPALRAKATPNVQILGYQPSHVVKDHLQRARAFLFAAKEDFGILPVEAQACGTPVLAYGQGGATETVIEGETGLFFPEQTPQSLVEAIQHFEQQRAQFSPQRIRLHAESFSKARFRQEFATCIETQWEIFQKKRGGLSA